MLVMSLCLCQRQCWCWRLVRILMLKLGWEFEVKENHKNISAFCTLSPFQFSFFNLSSNFNFVSNQLGWLNFKQTIYWWYEQTQIIKLSSLRTYAGVKITTTFRNYRSSSQFCFSNWLTSSKMANLCISMSPSCVMKFHPRILVWSFQLQLSLSLQCLCHTSVNTRVAVVRFAIRQLASSYICFWSAIDLKGIACLRQATNIKDVYLKRQTVAMVANDAKHTVGTSISTVTLWTRGRRHNGDVIALPAWSSGPRAVRAI